MAGTAPLASYDPLVAVEALTDVTAVTLVAEQLNDGTLNQNVQLGAAAVKNLSSGIADIELQTTAQGASILVLTIIDPTCMLTTRFGNAPAFIDVDDSGELIPVDVNFPQNTGMWWRLMQANPSGDTATANLKLTFEDRIVVELRNLGGPKTAGKDQTRAEFIASCVAQVPDIVFRCPALEKPAGSVGGDLTVGQITSAAAAAQKQALAALNVPSAKQPNAPKSKRNPLKKPRHGGAAKKLGAVWTPGGWKYTKPIDGQSPKTLDLLNPPTNGPDDSGVQLPSGAYGGGTF